MLQRARFVEGEEQHVVGAAAHRDPQRLPLLALPVAQQAGALPLREHELHTAFAWAGERGVQIVLPQWERSCLLCNGEREQWEALGIAVGCGPDDMLLLAFDKARTLEHAAAGAVRIPPTRVPTSLAECHAAGVAVGYPCIIKPRFSDFWDGNRF